MRRKAETDQNDLPFWPKDGTTVETEAQPFNQDSPNDLSFGLIKKIKTKTENRSNETEEANRNWGEKP